MNGYFEASVNIFSRVFQEIIETQYGLLYIAVCIFLIVIGLWEGAVKIMSKR